MKKIYIIPEVQIMKVETSQIIAYSDKLDVDGAKTASGNSGGWTKENTRQDYNVWNDDWQNQ